MNRKLKEMTSVQRSDELYSVIQKCKDQSIDNETLQDLYYYLYLFTAINQLNLDLYFYYQSS